MHFLTYFVVKHWQGVAKCLPKTTTKTHLQLPISSIIVKLQTKLGEEFDLKKKRKYKRGICGGRWIKETVICDHR